MTRLLTQGVACTNGPRSLPHGGYGRGGQSLESPRERAPFVHSHEMDGFVYAVSEQRISVAVRSQLTNHSKQRSLSISNESHICCVCPFGSSHCTSQVLSVSALETLVPTKLIQGQRNKQSNMKRRDSVDAVNGKNEIEVETRRADAIKQKNQFNISTPPTAYGR